MMGLKELPFERSHHHGLLGVGMVVTNEMQNAVHHQQGNFIVWCAGMLGTLRNRNLGADHDVTEDHRHIARPLLATIHWEGEYIGGSEFAEKFTFEFSNRVGIYERERQFAMGT